MLRYVVNVVSVCQGISASLPKRVYLTLLIDWIIASNCRTIINCFNWKIIATVNMTGLIALIEYTWKLLLFYANIEQL